MVQNYQQNGYASASRHKVLGVVGNFCRFPSPAIALAISHNRRSAFGTILVKSTEDAIKFQETLKRNDRVTFLSLNEAKLTAYNELNFEESIRSYCGFIGYAVELLELPPEYEYLRSNLFMTLLGNLSVWDTTTNLDAAKLKLKTNGVALNQVPFDHNWYARDQLISEFPKYLRYHFSFTTFRTEELKTKNVDEIISRLDSKLYRLAKSLHMINQNNGRL